MARARSSNAPPKNGRANLFAVAERAKVSVATVSRTVNRVPTVDPSYAQRVWDAIAEVGYIPNTQARALVSGRSRLIGVIISDITNPFFPELIQSYEDEAVEAGYEILIGSTGNDPRRMEVCIDRMLQRKVDGVAVMTFGIEAPLLDRLAAHEIPLVFIDVAPSGKAMLSIRVDYASGISEAVQHLVHQGHRRVAFICGPRGLHSAESRLEAFLAAARQHKIRVPKQYIYAGDHTLEGGLRGARSLLRRVDRPSAVMCSNDMTAIGVLHAAAESRLRIPEDLSVVGFDDIHIARFMIPPLTTIRMSCQELAHSAFKMLRGSLELRPVLRAEHLNVKTKLKIRGSTGAPAEVSKDPSPASTPTSRGSRLERVKR